MKFSIIASALALASTAFASYPINGCVTKKQANKLVERFIGIQTHQGSDLGDARQTAEKLLVKDYQEISDSILSLERQPLGGITFQGKESYITGLLNAPATTEIETLGVYVAGCNKILWQWNFKNVGTAQYEVKGFNLFTVNRKLQITKTELEFNSVAWGLDTFQLPCPTSGGAAPSESAAPSAAPSAVASVTPAQASAKV